MDETLCSSPAWLQKIFHSFNDVAWSAEPTQLKTLFLSQSAQDIYGHPVSEFFDNPHLWRSLIHSEDRDRVESLLPLLFSIGILDLEYQIVRPNGEIRWLYNRLRVIRDHQGTPLRIDGMATDITDIKSNLNPHRLNASTDRASEAFFPSLIQKTSASVWQDDSTLRQFRAIFNESLDAMLIANDQGNYIDANPAACELFGLPKSELLGCNISNFTEPGFDFEQAWHRFLELGRFQGEFRLLRPDGTVRETEFAATANILPHCHLSVLRDMTERKQAQEALYNSEARYRNLVETTSDWVWEIDEELVYTYISPKVHDLLGYNPQELKGVTPCNLMPLREQQRMVNFLCQLLVVKEPFSGLENINIHKDGHLVVMEMSGVPVFDAHGKFCGYHGISRDITDRHRMEEALRESQQKYQTLFEILPIGISITDEEGNLIEANPASEQILGISTAVQTQPQYDSSKWHIVRDFDTPVPRSDLAGVKVLPENRVIKNVEITHIKPNGTSVWLSVTAAPIPITGYGVVVAYTDISERKQAEETLRQSQHFIQKIADTTPHIIYLFDLAERRTVYINDQVSQILGYTVEEVYAQGSKWLHQVIHPEDLHVLRTAYNRFTSLSDREVSEVSYRLRHKQGGWRWLETREVVFTRNADGSPRQILGSVQDITERKKFEETLRLQAQRERLMGAMQRRIRQSLNLDEILNTSVEEVRQLLQNDRVLLFKLCEDNIGRVVTESVAPGLPATVGMEFPNEVFPEACYLYYCHGLPRIVADITCDEIAPCMTEFLQQLGVKSKLVIPILRSTGQGTSSSAIFSQSLLWGVMVAHDCSGKRQWQQWEIDLLSSLATQIGIAIQQSELYLQLETQLTKHQQTQSALQQAKEAAEIANRAKSEFVANMSHELRTPLNGILGYTQILKKDTNLTDQQQNSLSIIHQCGEHLLTLIEDILDLSKIEAQKMELSVVEFHLPNFIKSLSDVFWMRAQQKNISFNYENLTPLPNGVVADKKRLRQILFNLLSNAVKFTDKGGVTFKVGYVENGEWEGHRGNLDNTISSSYLNSRSPKTIRFQIKDTGIGIEPSQLEEIFLPFHQVSDQAHAIEGSGLGLAISQKLVQMMGSNIKVKSTLGQGSVFWFDLDLPPVSGWHEPNPSSDRPIIGYKGQKRQILIVDDHQVNRSLFRELLEFVGFGVLEAVDGQEALNKAQEFHPDVILMDLLMPVLDGLEATRRLRQLPELNNIIILALSANVAKKMKQESLASGCQEFLSKPVQADRLLDAIANHLGLEWVYEEKRYTTDVKPNLNNTSLILPPLTEITALSELVKIGDIAGILERAESWEKLDDTLVPFATQIYQLAKGFKLKQLREILQCSLSSKL